MLIDHGFDVSKVIPVETFELAHCDIGDREHLDTKMGELSVAANASQSALAEEG
jgi:hypothetical protein